MLLEVTLGNSPSAWNSHPSYCQMGVETLFFCATHKRWDALHVAGPKLQTVARASHKKNEWEGIKRGGEGQSITEAIRYRFFLLSR